MHSGLVAGSLAVGVEHCLGRSTAAAVDAVVVGRIEAAVKNMGHSLGCLARALVNHCVSGLACVCISQDCLIPTSILAVPVDC